MNVTKETMAVLQNSINYAKQHGYEYVTPEVVWLVLCRTKSFVRALRECGGNTETLSGKLENFCEVYIDKTAGKEPQLSIGLSQAFSLAQEQAKSSGRIGIELLHLINALLNLPENYGVYFIKEQGIEPVDLIRALQEESGDNGTYKTIQTRENIQGNPAPGTELYAPCLNDTLSDINPLIGREDELERTMEILCRRDKNNPLYIGEPGVGKTALVYGFVDKIRHGKVPVPLKGSRVFSLDLGSMLAGTQYRGDFEKRLKKVLSDVEKEEKPIVFIDEIHNLSGAGAVGESSFDAANILKPYLSFGRIRFIGATTFDEYRKYFEKNKSLVRRFQSIEIKEPSEKETIKILKGLRKKYEDFHGVKYKRGVLEFAVSMSAKHINERFLPDKAIDLIDEAGAYKKLHPDRAVQKNTQMVEKEDIALVLTKICRVPIEAVEVDETEGLNTLDIRLRSQIFGQDEAISLVVNAIKLSRAGLADEDKPLASLLFVGPTGVGKTEVAKSLARELGVRLVRFDMSEYEEKHAVAKRIGSRAGDVGYEEGGLLTGEIRKSPSCVLLLDEIEKAHPDIYNVLLQIMDYATLTDNQGKKADFRNVLLIMTSNAGANRIGKSGIGFNNDTHDNSALMEEVKRVFQPEFRNRLNKIVSFNGMDEAMAERVIEKKLKELQETLLKKKIRMNVDTKARDLIKKHGVSREFGAREIDRVIRNEIKPLFVDDILFGGLKKGGKLMLTENNGEFRVNVHSRGGKL